MKPGTFAACLAFGLCGLLSSAAIASTQATVSAAVDETLSRIGFTLKTRWGQTLDGRFPRYEGEILTLADGRHRVRLRMFTADVEIVGYPTYTRFTRGRGFFDAEHYPTVEFLSDAYPDRLTRDGGELGGLLTIRGVQRREVFTLMPSGCDRPGRDCDVLAAGSVRRGHYGVDRWAFAVSDKVRFTLRVRTREADAP